MSRMGYSENTRYKCFCVVDSNYVEPALLAIKSYFEHNSFPITLYMFDDFDTSRFEQFKNLTIEKVGDLDVPYYDHYPSYKDSINLISAKIKIFDDLIGKYDYAAYFDVDSIFTGNVDETFKEYENDLMGVPELWAAEDAHRGDKYLNVGFLIYKLGKPLLEAYKKFLSNTWVLFPEQDFLSYFIKNREVLPLKYNYMPAGYPILEDIRFIHFSSLIKPFSLKKLNFYIVKHSKRYLETFDIYFDYVSKNRDLISDSFYNTCLSVNKRLSILRQINFRRDNESSNIQR